MKPCELVYIHHARAGPPMKVPITIPYFCATDQIITMFADINTPCAHLDGEAIRAGCIGKNMSDSKP